MPMTEADIARIVRGNLYAPRSGAAPEDMGEIGMDFDDDLLGLALADRVIEDRPLAALAQWVARRLRLGRCKKTDRVLVPSVFCVMAKAAKLRGWRARNQNSVL